MFDIFKRVFLETQFLTFDSFSCYGLSFEKCGIGDVLPFAYFSDLRLQTGALYTNARLIFDLVCAGIITCGMSPEQLLELIHVCVCVLVPHSYSSYILRPECWKSFCFQKKPASGNLNGS